jgi:hypothetical protein
VFPKTLLFLNSLQADENVIDPHFLQPPPPHPHNQQDRDIREYCKHGEMGGHKKEKGGKGVMEGERDKFFGE